MQCLLQLRLEGIDRDGRLTGGEPALRAAASLEMLSQPGCQSTAQRPEAEGISITSSQRSRSRVLDSYFSKAPGSVRFLPQVEGRRSPPVMRLWTVHSEGAGIATASSWNPGLLTRSVASSIAMSMLVQAWCVRP